MLLVDELFMDVLEAKQYILFLKESTTVLVQPLALLFSDSGNLLLTQTGHSP